MKQCVAAAVDAVCTAGGAVLGGVFAGPPGAITGLGLGGAIGYTASEYILGNTPTPQGQIFAGVLGVVPGALATKLGTRVVGGAVAEGATAEAAAVLAEANSSNIIKAISTRATRAIQSTQGRLLEHEAKLAAYKANPWAYDNLGHLARNAGRPDILKKIIDSRIKHLEDEIRNFRNYINKLESGIIEP